MNIYRGRSHTEVYLASVLYECIEDQDLASVEKVLLEKQADANIVLPRKGVSCFHLAIGNGSEKIAMEITTLILQNGGNPNVQSDEGLTPVHIAAAWGRINILKLLLQCGGDPQQTDNCYKTALNYAVEEGWDEAANVIRDFIDCQRQAIYDNYFSSEKPCIICLDKIILNNGFVVGEYQLVDSGKDLQELEDDTRMNLNILPHTSGEEYVLSWCNNNKLGLLTDDDSSAEYEYNGSTAFMQSQKDSNSSKISSIDSSFRGEAIPKLHTETCRMKWANVTFKDRSDLLKTYISEDICKHEESSRESGILTLPDSSDVSGLSETVGLKKAEYCWNESQVTRGIENLKIGEDKDTSSDYCTCTDESELGNILEKTIYDFSTSKNVNTLNCNNINDDQNSIVSVAEIYKYVDVDEGVVLYQRRLLVTPVPSDQNESGSSQASLPKSFDYDTDTLRKELTIQGFDPGPITKTTKRVYLRKLYQLKKQPQLTPVEPSDRKKVYSPELQNTLKAINWYENLSQHQYLEDVIKKEFTSPDPSRRWRGGTAKTSFTYLLLDSRVTQNLPHRCDKLERSEVWEIFLSAIFYVGKGKKSRPFAHLNEAISKYNRSDLSCENEKIRRILNIWNDDQGVICLHVFQNAIPVESYTREAAMIGALKLENITNIKGGEFYGRSATWSQKQKNLLGTYLLYKAMKIFLIEGERQIFPCDVK